MPPVDGAATATDRVVVESRVFYSIRVTSLDLQIILCAVPMTFFHLIFHRLILDNLLIIHYSVARPSLD